MILDRLAGPQQFYRMHTPRWGYMPLSGAGAARKGGRLNREGQHALYLARTPDTARAEFQQYDSLLKPGLIATYEVSLATVVDFSGGYDPKHWDPAWADFWCEWRDLWFIHQVEPPSWLLADLALDAGCSGILYPSAVQPGGVNLVIYVQQLAEADILRVHDPDGDLPSDPTSWTRG